MTAPSSDQAGIRQAIRAVRTGGWNLHEVYDGEDLTRVSTEAEAIKTIVAVDDATLSLRSKDGNEKGWIRFVMGNDPEEVICDHTTNLSPVLDLLIEGWWS